jgi:hypothetical protein
LIGRHKSCGLSVNRTQPLPARPAMALMPACTVRRRGGSEVGPAVRIRFAPPESHVNLIIPKRSFPAYRRSVAV